MRFFDDDVEYGDSDDNDDDNDNDDSIVVHDQMPTVEEIKIRSHFETGRQQQQPRSKKKKKKLGGWNTFHMYRRFIDGRFYYHWEETSILPKCHRIGDHNRSNFSS